MRKLFILMAFIATRALAGTPAHLDIETIRIGALPARTELFFYSTEQAALKGLENGPEESQDYLCLNGNWDFSYFKDGRDIPENLSSISSWSQIKVPGNWEVQRFGYPIYTNTTYEFAPVNPNPPHLPEAIEAGVYHRKFSIPDGWRGKPVYLTLAGASAGVYVYVNSALAGYAEDSKNPARYDISSLLKEGENDLYIKIFRWSTGSFLECQDFWRISGIERDVYLTSETLPADFDIDIVSTFGPDLKDGIFKLRFLGEPSPLPVSIKLLDTKSGAVVLSKSGRLSDGSLEGIVAGAKKWSAESPELYTLVVEIAGRFTAFDVGFRRFEMGKVERDGREYPVFLVNGQPVKFKGVNYHEHNPETGHYVTKELIEKDLRLMKAMNINAIRTCHYPQGRIFYELCDRMGFYVYDEANIESHGMGYNINRTLGNNPDWGRHHLDRVMTMYRRTANYPCVTILSLGNEAGNGVNFYDCYRALKALEVEGMNRPVCYERAENEWNTDMIVPMYPGASWFENIGKTIPSRPAVPCEYAHAMGNSTGSLDWQWEQIYKYPNTQGGFIWDWVDQGLKETDASGRIYYTYGGDYGKDLPSDGNFLCNGLVNPDRDPHPAAAEVKWNYQNIKVTAAPGGGFDVLNRFYFISLSGYTLRWTLSEDGVSRKSGKIALSAAPQQSEHVAPALPALRGGRENRMKFEVLDPEGAVVAIDDVLLNNAERKAYAYRFDSAKVSDGPETMVLSNGDSKVIFDLKAGVISGYIYKGKPLIDGAFGFRPNFWRAPVDNDYGNGWPARTQVWKQASKTFDASASKVVSGGSEAMLVEYALPGGGKYSVTYRLDSRGVLKVDAALTGSRLEKVEIPRIGFRFRLPGADAFEYYGRGPEENYCDRFEGTLPGIYSASATASCYPYVRPQESGHHTGARWLDISRRVSVAGENFEFNVLRCSIEDLDSEEADAPYMWYNFDPADPHDEDAARNKLRKHQHISDVPVRDYAEVCIDYMMSGVGGYDSWGARTEPGRCLWSDKDYSFSFALIPYSSPARRSVRTEKF